MSKVNYPCEVMISGDANDIDDDGAYDYNDDDDNDDDDDENYDYDDTHEDIQTDNAMIRKSKRRIMSQQKIDVCVLPMSLSPAIKADVIWLRSSNLSFLLTSWLDSQSFPLKFDTIHFINCIFSISVILKFLSHNE